MKITQAGPEHAALISRIYAQSWKTGYCGLLEQAYLDNIKDDHWEKPFTAWLAGDAIQAKIAWAGEEAAGAIAYGRFIPPTGAKAITFSGGYIPVSYTHLDVYKRQLLHRVPR